MTKPSFKPKILPFLVLLVILAATAIFVRPMMAPPETGAYKFLTKKDLSKLPKRHDDYRLITANEAKKIFDQKQSLIIDARPEKNFNKYHIPGATNIEPGQLSKQLLLMQAMRHMPIMVYCFSKSCPLSEELAVELISHGFTRVQVFKGGLFEWVKKDWPLDSVLENSSPNEMGPDEILPDAQPSNQ